MWPALLWCRMTAGPKAGCSGTVRRQPAWKQPSTTGCSMADLSFVLTLGDIIDGNVTPEKTDADLERVAAQIDRLVSGEPSTLSTGHGHPSGINHLDICTTAAPACHAGRQLGCAPCRGQPLPGGQPASAAAAARHRGRHRLQGGADCPWLAAHHPGHHGDMNRRDLCCQSYRKQIFDAAACNEPPLRANGAAACRR
jgi:hypothetical protein